MKVKKQCFSQWYEAGFEQGGCYYTTAEHWMMAEKARLFNDVEMEQAILKNPSPREAQKYGRKVRYYNSRIWERFRYNIVVRGNFLKFHQNLELGSFLIDTADLIIEASPNDKIWGIGMSESSEQVRHPFACEGLNLLGFALMVVST